MSGTATEGPSIESYKRLAGIFHDVLSSQDLDTVLERIADTLTELIPYDTLTIYTADEKQRMLVPILARDPWEAEEILNSPGAFGEGLSGWAAEHREPVLANDAHNDPRSKLIEGTELSPESMIAVPLLARGAIVGVLVIYRLGDGARFSQEEFTLACLFGDAASLAIDNAQVRAFLEHQAQTDALTGAYNHRFFQERLRSELNRASRSHDSVGLLMFDIDDFKRLNDAFGHQLGDQVLIAMADMLRKTIRASDVLCRLGGEEFAVIMPSCDAGAALGLATRIAADLAELDFAPAGAVTVSIGIAQGPEHAMNPRELLHCAEAAMMTAKARGKNRIVLFDEGATERPDVDASHDVRSIAHMKMLQSLSGKLNRLNDVKQIGRTIGTELRTLIDYHNCRIYAVHDGICVPIAFMGEWAAEDEGETADLVQVMPIKVGEGITGRVAATRRPLLIPNALECDFAIQLPGTVSIEESLLAVPLIFGHRCIGVIILSKLGINGFDQDDMRLMEILAGNASVALENARLYEQRGRDIDNARALLEAAAMMNTPSSFEAIAEIAVTQAAKILGATQTSLWMEDDEMDTFRCVAHHGYADDPTIAPILYSVLDRSAAELFFKDRTEPYVLSPEEGDRFFAPPSGVVSRTVVVAPLPTQEGASGWMIVRQPDENPYFFDTVRLALLAAFAYQAAVVLEKAVISRRQKEDADIASSLLQFSHGLATSSNLDEVLASVVEVAARTLGGLKASVWLQEADTGELVCEAQHGHDEKELERLVAARFNDQMAKSFLDREWPFVMRPSDMAGMPQTHGSGQERIYAVAPLKLDGGRLGALVAMGPPGFSYSEKKMRLLTGMAQQARIAISNALSFEVLESTFIATVESLANALEAKDQYTSAHTRTITDLSLEVGIAMGMSAPELKKLELAALFHDIGKIGIPTNILWKPGPLDAEEEIIMQGHPELGERILAPIDRLHEVSPIVRACHERWDGGGYPDGRAGEDIPLEARIIFVCDAFDAMTTDRPYRARLPLEEAFRRLELAAGTQFDPKIVDLFLKVMNESTTQV